MTGEFVTTLEERLAAGAHIRQTSLPAAHREFHRRLLHSFLARGTAPEPNLLSGHAGELGLDAGEALEALAVLDLIVADATTRRVLAAYPFAAAPTRHRVRLSVGDTTYAMCAIDALGVPLMTGRDGEIVSTDPVTDDPIEIRRRAGQWHWSPETTVVLAAATDTVEACRSVADCCCPHINFHTGPDHAHAYLRAHPDARGDVLTQASAMAIADEVFGHLLDPDRP